jgi:DNA transformation protein
MSSSPEFAAHCLELLSPLGTVRSRRMFGGHGFYVDDLFVGLGSGDRLYLKVDEESRPHFEAAGCEPFDFDTKDGKRVVLGFWSAPDEALESPMLMQPWARFSMQAALRARNAKKPSRRPEKKAAKKASTKKPAAAGRKKPA